MKSIIQEEKECYICFCQNNLERHHIFGASNRKHSEKYGLTVYLCKKHHTGKNGVHNNKQMALAIKRVGQRAFEKRHSREEFMQIFRRNYLED